MFVISEAIQFLSKIVFRSFNVSFGKLVIPVLVVEFEKTFHAIDLAVEVPGLNLNFVYERGCVVRGIILLQVYSFSFGILKRDAIPESCHKPPITPYLGSISVFCFS